MTTTHPPLTLRVAAVNVKRGCWNRTNRHHNFDLLMDMLGPLEHAPHILFMSECSHFLDFNREPLFEVLERLDSLWGYEIDQNGRTSTQDTYRAFVSTVPNSINVPGLFVCSRYVRPRRWYDGDTRHVYANTLDAEIGGRVYSLKSVHWNGSRGEVGFLEQADMYGQMGSRPMVMGGDFNCTSDEPDEVTYEDWGRRCDATGRPWARSQKGARTPDGWVTNTAYSRFLEHGWWDAGSEAKDYTVTTNTSADGGSELRIDRIAVSDQAMVTLVPESYTVHTPPPDRVVSDHRVVECQLTFGDWR